MKRSKTPFRAALTLAALAGATLACALFPAQAGQTVVVTGEMSLEQAQTMVAQAALTAQTGTPAAGGTTGGTATAGPAGKASASPTARLSPTAARGASGAAFPSSTSLPTELFPVPNLEIRPTFTPRPTQIPTQTTTPQPTLTPTATYSPGLPGLTMSDVVTRLQNEKKFDCKESGSDPYKTLWMCDYQEGVSRWFHVDLYATSAAPVYALQAAVFQSTADDSAAAAILAYLAALPYSGSNPAAAGNWVTQNLPQLKGGEDARQTTIGGVVFRLYGEPNGRYLEMGTPP